MNNVIALVPMKGHSERVPNKNIRNFAGKPLFFWVLSTLAESPHVKEVHVDTDSDKIRNNIYEHFGPSVNIINRPEPLCGDYVSVNKIIEHDLSVIKDRHFIQTHVTNPLLDSSTIECAIIKYFEAISIGYDSLFSATRYQSRFYTHKGTAINHDPRRLIRTQDLHPVYEENSNFYIFSRESFQTTSARIGKRPYLFEIPKAKDLDIDDESDFSLGEVLFRLIKHEEI